jgi:hypothetical protein
VTREEAKARLSRGKTLAALGGLLAGLASFGIGEAVYQMIPARSVPQRDRLTGQEIVRPSFETMNIAEAQNAALAFGALGLCLGGLLGIAGGLARRSASTAVTAALLGAVLGMTLGVGVSRVLVPLSLQAQFKNPESDVLISLVIHGLIWGLVGASAGLAFVVGLGERRLIGRALTAGLAGAVLGAVAFDLIGAAFFSSAATVAPISQSWPTRLMAELMASIGTAAALVLLLPAPAGVVTKQQADAAVPKPES